MTGDWEILVGKGLNPKEWMSVCNRNIATWKKHCGNAQVEQDALVTMKSRLLIWQVGLNVLPSIWTCLWLCKLVFVLGPAQIDSYSSSWALRKAEEQIMGVCTCCCLLLPNCSFRRKQWVQLLFSNSFLSSCYFSSLARRRQDRKSLLK